MKQFHKDAQHEFVEGEAHAGTSAATKLGKMFEVNGMKAFVHTGVGLVTPSLWDSYHTSLGLSKVLKNSLIIPTWCTPQHFATFEHCGITTPTERTTFYNPGERGWSGQPEKTVYSNFTNLMTHPGCTWDRKLNYWVEKPLALDESLTVSQCLQIWTESEGLEFKRSPLDIIESTNGVGKLRFNMNELNLAQIGQLEKRFGVKLTDFWKAQKFTQVAIGGITFINKDMRYYAKERNGELEEATNFAVEITKVVRKGGTFVRQGIVYYEGKQEPFELPYDVFLTNVAFFKAITYFFLNRGLGIPLVSSKWKPYLLEVVDRLSANCMVDASG